MVRYVLTVKMGAAGAESLAASCRNKDAKCPFDGTECPITARKCERLITCDEVDASDWTASMEKIETFHVNEPVAVRDNGCAPWVPGVFAGYDSGEGYRVRTGDGELRCDAWTFCIPLAEAFPPGEEVRCGQSS